MGALSLLRGNMNLFLTLFRFTQTIRDFLITDCPKIRETRLNERELTGSLLISENEKQTFIKC